MPLRAVPLCVVVVGLLLSSGACADADVPVGTRSSPVAPSAVGHAPAATERVQGADRYATAIALSQREFPGGSDVVVLASGEDFPDALVSAPAAQAFSAPLLLTRRDRIPETVTAEVARLGASTVVVPGGDTAVSPSVVDALQDAGLEVRRFDGRDRYATAASIATTLLRPGQRGGRVFVASGTDHPDALSAAAAASAVGAPVLLVAPDSLPTVTRRALEALAPESVVVVGGERAVTPEVFRALDRALDGVVPERVSGGDRYETSAAVQQATGSTTWPTAFLATGRDYADALAAAAVGAPVLLVERTCVPPAPAALLAQRAPASLVAVGGSTVLEEGVTAGRVCGAGG